MKKHDDFYRLLSDLFLLVTGVLGAVFCLITAFDLPVPEGFALIASLSITGFALALGRKKQDRITAPVLLVVFLLIPGFLFRTELVESFRNLWGILSSIYALGYGFFQDYVPEGELSINAVGPALLALTVLEAYLACLCVRTWRRTTPTALTLLLCVGPCFILTDTPPATLPLLAAMFSVLTQAFSQPARRREEGENLKAVAFAAWLSAVLLAALLAIFPQKSFSPPITWSQLSKKIQQWGNARENQGNVQAGLTGNQESVNLSTLSALPNRPIPVLYATASEDAYLYLRGTSYTEFDGVYWKHGEEMDWGQNALFPYLGWKNGATLSIETVNPEELLYTPYQITQMPAGGTLVADCCMKNTSKTTKYTMHFLPQTEPIAPNETYDIWVHEHCLALPERTRTGVLAWWSEQLPTELSIPGEENPEGLREFAESVAAQVAKCASYNRNPGKVPAGVDFCTWFLNDAKDGYCVHYASSCAALLRALGLPCRYVSGYVCEATANVEARVSNLQAHAWVEAWIGGRWIPIEPTPADATEFTGILPETTYEHREEEPEEDDYTRPKEKNPRSNDDDDDDQQPTAATKPGSGPGSGGANDNAEPVDLTLLWVFLAIIGIPALIVGRRLLKLRLWDKRVTRAKPNYRAQLLYRQMLRLEKLGGGKIPEQAVVLVKKAQFSQHTLTDVELAAMRQICDEQSGRLAISGFWNRIYCKYVLAVI